MLPAPSASLATAQEVVSALTHGVDPHRAGHSSTSADDLAQYLTEALDEVLAHAAAAWPADPAASLEAAAGLHAAMMNRIQLATQTYVNLHIGRMGASNPDQRLRLAHELHDRVAHGMALALQDLDLYHHYAGRDPERARAKLAAATSALGDSLRALTRLSADLCGSAGPYDTAIHDPSPTGGIERALREYLAAHGQGPVRAVLKVLGDTGALPPRVGGEVYLIVREAVRNALRHADSTELALLVLITRTAVIASVTDNGRGFNPVGACVVPGVGLESMNERARRLRGTLALISAAGRGTTVGLWVPVGDR